jgi:hypothetical protein
MAAQVKLRQESDNGGVDAAARIHARIAGRIKLRNTLPPLASNDLLGSVQRYQDQNIGPSLETSKKKRSRFGNSTTACFVGHQKGFAPKVRTLDGN